MANILLQDIDTSLFDALKAVAAERNSSVEEEIVIALRERFRPYLGELKTDRSELLRRAEAIAAMTPKGVVQTDSTIIIRQMRDEK